MHCPNCGHKQVSIEIKFCSKCGFPMGLIAEVLSNGGFLPQLEDLNKRPRFFNRRNGIFSAILWFILWFMITILAAAAGADEAAAVPFIFGLFGALIIGLISLVFLKSGRNAAELPYQQPARAPQLYGVQNHQALPTGTAIPASDYAAPAGRWRAETDDLSTPGSVTEGTTRLLEKDRND